MKWQKIDTCPRDGTLVLIFYKNSYGLGRIIKAFYTKKFTLELHGDDYEEPDYDEKTDTYYYPEGWWEVIDNWGDYSFVAVYEGIPSHWMELPEPPKDEEIK